MSQKHLIYLDHAAATPLDSQVLAVMQPYFTELFYNPSALYWPAQQVAKAMQAAREQIGTYLGARPSELIFTAGGTEANNIAIHGVMRRFEGKHFITTAIEHDAVLRPAEQYQTTVVPVTRQGIVAVDAVAQAITDQTVLISVQYANNEIGTIQPIREIGQLVAQVRADRKAAGNATPLYLHTDACQAGNYLDIHAARLGVDLLTLNGGKLYGPKQSGVLYIKAGVVLEPVIQGGGQERNVRSGTENVPAIIGLATALRIAQDRRAEETKRLQQLQHFFIKGLPATAIVNGSLKKRLPNNVHVTFPGIDNERLLIQLDEAGVLAAAGSACSASSDEPSHVLKALGLSDDEARSSLRFSFGRSTTEADLQITLDLLARFAQS